MIKKSLMFFLVFVLMTSGVIAAELSVSVHTLPSHNVEIYLLEPVEKWSRIDSFSSTSDASGLMAKTFSVTIPEVNLYIIVSEGSVKLYSQKFEHIETAAPFEVYVLVNKTEPVVANTTNETVVANVTAPVVTTEVAVGKTEPAAGASASGNSDGLLSGMAIFNFESTGSKIFYSVVGIVIFGVFLTLLLLKRGHHHASLEEPRVVKLSEVSKQSGSSRIEQAEAKLQQASQELKEAQEEIIKLRSNKNELSEAQLAFQKAKENLDRVKQQVGNTEGI